MKKLHRLFRKETGTWILATLTILTGAFSVWTSNYLYRVRGQQVVNEETFAATPGRCTFSFAISDLPPCKNIDVVGISIDRSSSMNQKEADGKPKVEHARAAARKFLETLRDAKAAGVATNVRASLNSFGAQGTSGGRLSSSYNSILLRALTTDITSVLSKVSGVQYTFPGTCIECGLRIANNQVQQSAQTKKVAILISDGLANHNWDGTTASAKDNAKAEAVAGRAKGVQYYVIGYGSNRDESVLKSIAGSTGSYVYKPNAQDWSNEMLRILTKICTP